MAKRSVVKRATAALASVPGQAARGSWTFTGILAAVLGLILLYVLLATSAGKALVSSVTSGVEWLISTRPLAL